MFKNLTLIIPTRNRSKRLRRILEYYSNTEIKIMICDSSKNKFPKKYLRKNVKYFHHKDWPYSKKLLNCIKKVKTKYTLLCADDDFIIPSAIKKCIEFLEKNKDYVSVQGHEIFFIEEGKRIIYTPDPYCIGWNISSNTGSGRIKEQFSRYMHQFYSIHRTKNLREAFDYDQKKLTEPNLIEFIVGTISCVNGKHKVLPTFYTVKETIPGSGNEEYSNFYEIMSKKNEQTNYFIDKVSNSLAKKDKISFVEAKKKVTKPINDYVARGKKDQKKIKARIRRFIDTNFPFLGNLLRNLYFPIKRWKKINLIRSVKGFPFYSNGDAKKELRKIDYLIKKHNVIN